MLSHKLHIRRARMDTSLVSAIVILLLVMDPIGNIPFFVSLMRNVKIGRAHV